MKALGRFYPEGEKYHLTIEVFKTDGTLGKQRERWEVRVGKSVLPRQVFLPVKNRIRKELTDCETENTLDLIASTERALAKVGSAFGCEIEKGREKADLYWISNKIRTVAWQIHIGENVYERRAKKLNDSRAWMRFVVLVKDRNRPAYIQTRQSRRKS